MLDREVTNREHPPEPPHREEETRVVSFRTAALRMPTAVICFVLVVTAVVGEPWSRGVGLALLGVAVAFAVLAWVSAIHGRRTYFPDGSRRPPVGRP